MPTPILLTAVPEAAEIPGAGEIPEAADPEPTQLVRSRARAGRAAGSRAGRERFAGPEPPTLASPGMSSLGIGSPSLPANVTPSETPESDGETKAEPPTPWYARPKVTRKPPEQAAPEQTERSPQPARDLRGRAPSARLGRTVTRPFASVRVPAK